jgi:thiamine pyrophosphate-dependent acetolactate synthase large subunit-like protein
VEQLAETLAAPVAKALLGKGVLPDDFPFTTGQKDLGNPLSGCDLSPIDFAAFAGSCGAEGYRCASADDVRPTIAQALRSPLRR